MPSEMVRSRFVDGRRKQEYKKRDNKENMANKELGYVYILTNPCHREEWVKIGKRSRPRRCAEQGAGQHCSSSAPRYIYI